MSLLLGGRRSGPLGKNRSIGTPALAVGVELAESRSRCSSLIRRMRYYWWTGFIVPNFYKFRSIKLFFHLWKLMRRIIKKNEKLFRPSVRAWLSRASEKLSDFEISNSKFKLPRHPTLSSTRSRCRVPESGSPRHLDCKGAVPVPTIRLGTFPRCRAGCRGGSGSRVPWNSRLRVHVISAHHG